MTLHFSWGLRRRASDIRLSPILLVTGPRATGRCSHIYIWLRSFDRGAEFERCKTMATRRFGLIVLLSSISLVFLAATTAHAEPLSVESLPETTGPEPQQDPAIAEAVELFKQRDFDGARQAFEKAAKENSDLPPAEIMMAQLFSQINQGAAVRRSLEQAVANSPKDPEAYVIMGEIAVGQGRITEAALLLNEAASLLEGFDRSESRKKILQIRTQAGLAAVAQARDDWKEAEKHLGAWLKLDPENVTALQRMARAKFQNKQAAEALKLLRQAAEGNEDVLTPEIQLARFYQEYGDKKNARIWIEQGLKAAPKDIPTRLVAAQWYLENGQIQEAAEQADAALRIDPNRAMRSSFVAWSACSRRTMSRLPSSSSKPICSRLVTSKPATIWRWPSSNRTIR